jgi:hypothetical protein
MSPDAHRKRLNSLDLTQEQAGELFGAGTKIPRGAYRDHPS